MSETVARRNPNRRSTHPVVLLNDTVLPALGRPKTEIARLLGSSHHQLYDILAGEQPIMPTTACSLGKLCGNSLRLWLNMRAAYDLWAAEQEVDVSSIPKLKSA